jgi:Cu-Zn family superoxide dismutase
MRNFRVVVPVAWAVCTAGLAACVFVAGNDDLPAEHEEQHGSVASARIEARSGATLSGHATFTQVAGGTLVEILVEGAPPGWHAVHVHEFGDCSAADGASAGSHFNPTGHPHGSPHHPQHHAGDLGNMWVDQTGNGRHVILMPELTVTPGANSVVGRSIIVHADIDDLTTQPTGNAGGRIGCGEIRG